MGDLLVLAERFVRLTSELEEVRSEILAALTNGAGAPRPFYDDRHQGFSPDHRWRGYQADESLEESPSR
jgi:hypothetical protein